MPSSHGERAGETAPRVSGSRRERQTADSASCGVPSLTMLGAPSQSWSGPLDPNIVSGGTRGRNVGRRARRSCPCLTDREAPSHPGSHGERAGERSRRSEESIAKWDRSRPHDQGSSHSHKSPRPGSAESRPLSICHPERGSEATESKDLGGEAEPYRHCPRPDPSTHSGPSGSALQATP